MYILRSEHDDAGHRFVGLDGGSRLELPERGCGVRTARARNRRPAVNVEAPQRTEPR